MAEVQSVYGDGAASLHTRSLRYGKLRNGVFLRVGGTGGGGGGVVRSKRQVWTVSAGNGGGEVDVVLGVNGYVFICKHSRGELAAGREEAKRMNVVTRMEEEEDKEGEGSVLYGDRNEEIQPETRREIARLGGVVGALVENGVRVDEEMVMAGYGVSLEMEEMGVGEDVFLGGEKGKMVVEAALKRVRG